MQMFQGMDKDNDGILDIKEVEWILRAMQQWEDKEIEVVFEMFDKGDGTCCSEAPSPFTFTGIKNS